MHTETPQHEKTDAVRVGSRETVRRFFCKHPANSLVVEKEQTVRKQNEDFEIVTYHLFCQNCRSAVDITHARMIGGVKAFLARGPNGGGQP